MLFGRLICLGKWFWERRGKKMLEKASGSTGKGVGKGVEKKVGKGVEQGIGNVTRMVGRRDRFAIGHPHAASFESGMPKVPV
jgi:hypothetical protein